MVSNSCSIQSAVHSKHHSTCNQSIPSVASAELHNYEGAPSTKNTVEMAPPLQMLGTGTITSSKGWRGKLDFFALSVWASKEQPKSIIRKLELREARN